MSGGFFLLFFKYCKSLKIRYNCKVLVGPVVKWYYAAFALPSREFDSRQVHIRKSRENGFFIIVRIERERGRENGSFPAAEHTNRWVRGSERRVSDVCFSPGPQSKNSAKAEFYYVS